MIRKRSRKI